MTRPFCDCNWQAGRQVSRQLNNHKHEGAECAQPLEGNEE